MVLRGDLLNQSENEACALGKDWMLVRRHGMGVIVLYNSGTVPGRTPFSSRRTDRNFASGVVMCKRDSSELNGALRLEQRKQHQGTIRGAMLLSAVIGWPRTRFRMFSEVLLLHPA